MWLRSAFKGQVANCITSGIEVQQAVETNGFCRTYKSSYGRVRLQTATRTDTDQFQIDAVGAFLPVWKSMLASASNLFITIINVIATDTSGNNDSFTFISTCNCLNSRLSTSHSLFSKCEATMLPAGVTTRDCFICQPFRLYVNGNAETVFVNNKFGRCKILFHVTRYCPSVWDKEITSATGFCSPVPTFIYNFTGLFAQWLVGCTGYRFGNVLAHRSVGLDVFHPVIIHYAQIAAAENAS